MIQVLNKEEYLQNVIENDRKIFQWYLTLSYDEKNKIYNTFEPIFKQINCEHNWYETTLYDEPILRCECGLIKKIENEKF